jgi:hypothetical protein
LDITFFPGSGHPTSVIGFLTASAALRYVRDPGGLDD